MDDCDEAEAERRRSVIAEGWANIARVNSMKIREPSGEYWSAKSEPAPVQRELPMR